MMPVYFAQHIDGGKIKIGTSGKKNIVHRFRMLRSKEGSGLILLGICTGGRKAERKFHKRFEKYALGHEWFEPGDEIKQFIEKYTHIPDYLESLTAYGKKSIICTDPRIKVVLRKHLRELKEREWQRFMRREAGPSNPVKYVPLAREIAKEIGVSEPKLLGLGSCVVDAETIYATIAFLHKCGFDTQLTDVIDYILEPDEVIQ